MVSVDQAAGLGEFLVSDADSVPGGAAAAARLAAAAVEAVGCLQRVFQPVGEREEGTRLRVVCGGRESGSEPREGPAHVGDHVGSRGAEAGEQSLPAAAEKALQQWEEERLTARFVGSIGRFAGGRQRLRHGARARCKQRLPLDSVRGGQGVGVGMGLPSCSAMRVRMRARSRRRCS